jgi:hypothetical protein
MFLYLSSRMKISTLYMRNGLPFVGHIPRINHSKPVGLTRTPGLPGWPVWRLSIPIVVYIAAIEGIDRDRDAPFSLFSSLYCNRDCILPQLILMNVMDFDIDSEDVLVLS